MALDILTAAQGGTCAIIKVKYYVYIPDLSENVSTALEDMQWKYSLLDFSPLLGKGRMVENHFNCCYSNLNHTALWALLPTMPCEFCNPEVDSILSCGW